MPLKCFLIHYVPLLMFSGVMILLLILLLYNRKKRLPALKIKGTLFLHFLQKSKIRSPVHQTRTRPKLPILRVPHLVFEEIINEIVIEDLISLSLCSRNMFRLIQFYLKNKTAVHLSMFCMDKNNYSIHYSWGVGEERINRRIITVAKNESQRLETTETLTIANQCVPISICKHPRTTHVKTYWMDPIFGFQEITSYVSKLLEKEINEVYFHPDSLWMIDWIKTVQKELRCADIDFDEILNKEQYVHILEECNANVLNLNAKPPPSFEYKKELRERISLSIGHGYWMTLEQLLKMRIPYVEIERSKLTGPDMNAFLKHWRRGGSPQLKYLFVQIEGEIEEVYDGLWEEMVPIRKYREFQIRDASKLKFYEGFEIHQQNDQWSKATTGFFRSKTFCMVVGDDFKEKLKKA